LAKDFYGSPRAQEDNVGLHKRTRSFGQSVKEAVGTEPNYPYSNSMSKIPAADVSKILILTRNGDRFNKRNDVNNSVGL